jgi:hypothetical protein
MEAMVQFGERDCSFRLLVSLVVTLDRTGGLVMLALSLLAITSWQLQVVHRCTMLMRSNRGLNESWNTVSEHNRGLGQHSGTETRFPTRHKRRHRALSFKTKNRISSWPIIAAAAVGCDNTTCSRSVECELRRVPWSMRRPCDPCRPTLLRWPTPRPNQSHTILPLVRSRRVPLSVLLYRVRALPPLPPNYIACYEKKSAAGRSFGACIPAGVASLLSSTIHCRSSSSSRFVFILSCAYVIICSFRHFLMEISEHKILAKREERALQWDMVKATVSREELEQNVLARMKSVTNASDETCISILKSNSYDLEGSIEAFLSKVSIT